MKLVYTNECRCAAKKPGDPVQVGDKITMGKIKMVVDYFRQPTSAASEGKVTLKMKPSDVGGRELYVSIIGAEWIEREDRDETPPNPLVYGERVLVNITTADGKLLDRFAVKGDPQDTPAEISLALRTELELGGFEVEDV